MDCMETNWISSAGKYISLFEEKFSQYCEVPFGVACSNCTTALHMSLVALGIGPGDEVLIPDFTLIVSANTVILAGAKPVLVRRGSENLVHRRRINRGQDNSAH